MALDTYTFVCAPECRLHMPANMRQILTTSHKSVLQISITSKLIVEYTSVV
jgi:hypothetical protein